MKVYKAGWGVGTASRHVYRVSVCVVLAAALVTSAAVAARDWHTNADGGDTALAGAAKSTSPALRVVMDNNYPPYVFLNAVGKAQGILVDQWTLWSERTGVAVEVIALPWNDALNGMNAGEFDVIDTIFYTAERAGTLDFTRSHARIDVSIFFKDGISGIGEASDLIGFRVAVKSGDANVDFLKAHGVTNFAYYDSYEDIIRAAAENKEAILVVDVPPALYLLYKYDIQSRFKQSPPLYSGEFHRAVRKGDDNLLALIEEGFAKITRKEYAQIDMRWIGVKVDQRWRRNLPYLIVGAIVTLSIIGILAVFNNILTRRIRHHTKHLSAEIAERKKSEEERGLLEARLRQSQKMEAVGQLAGGIAHDFNNILQGVLGYGDLAMAEIETDSPVHEHISEILKAAHRAKTLVSQLLAFSRQQVLDMNEVNLNDIIADLVKMLRRVIGEHITLNVLLDKESGIVRADRGQIGQILTNLCVNARDAVKDGGTITIETRNVLLDTAYCETHTWATPGHYVLMSTTDTGRGMDNETLANIFEPFFTTKGVGEGTGLGLAMVYGLVKQHGGLIHVDSRVGEGSTFEIYLPRVQATETAIKANGTMPAVGGSETILLADDDKGVQSVVASILRHAGYRVLLAGDGLAAIRVFDEHAGAIDMALLDVVMPKLGGKAVFDHIRKKRLKTRVLFASGYNAGSIHTNFILDEGMQLIQKPYRRDDLLRKIRDVLDA